MHGYILSLREHVCLFAWEVRERADLAPVDSGLATTPAWAFDDAMACVRRLGKENAARHAAEEAAGRTGA